MIRRFVVLSATGDLASRHLLPALARLHEAGKLPAELSILGAAREDWDTATLRAHMTERLARHAAGTPPASRHAVVSRRVYQRADASDPADMARMLDDVSDSDSSSDPDRMSLAVNINGAGDRFELERVELDRDLAAQDLSAYARLILDILEGDPTLSIRGDEAEESWRIVEPILEAWAAERCRWARTRQAPRIEPAGPTERAPRRRGVPRWSKRWPSRSTADFGKGQADHRQPALR